MRSSGPRLLVTGAGVLCAIAAHATTVLAQDAATAGALFDRGVADMQAGHFGTGCPAIAESQRLDPRPGTLFTLAECEGKWGKVASAVAHYEEYLGLVSRLPADQQKRHQGRVELAESAIRRIKPGVPKLTLLLPRGAPEGSVVTRDGVVLQGAALGVALPIDPGDHVIVTRAPGGAEREQRVSVALGEAKRVELEMPASSPAATPEPTAVPETGRATEAAAPPSSTDGSTQPGAGEQAVRAGSSQRTWGWILTGLGAAGVAVGSVSGVLVILRKGTVSDECDGNACSPAGKDAADSGKQLALVSDLGFGVGAAGLLGGAVLLLTAPKSEAPPRTGARRIEPVLLGDRSGAWGGVRGTF